MHFAMLAPPIDTVLARITELKTAGASLREIGAVLEAEGRPPKRGGSWHPETLRRAAARVPGRPSGTGA